LNGTGRPKRRARAFAKSPKGDCRANSLSTKDVFGPSMLPIQEGERHSKHACTIRLFERVADGGDSAANPGALESGGS